jgi:hypothetical protein
MHVGTWEPGPVTGRGEWQPAFTADGRVMALETGAGSVRLVRTADGHELVRLDNPHQDPLVDLAFAPDGTRLVGCSFGSARGVHVWDLRLIRRGLAARGLDWDPTPPPDPPARATSVEVLVPIKLPAVRPPASEPAGLTWARMSEYLAVDPDLADPHHYRAHAWDRLGKIDRAAADFDDAVRLAPYDREARECRIDFLFNRRRYADALAAFERGRADDPGWEPSADLLTAAALWYAILAPADRRDGAKGYDLAREAVRQAPGHAAARAAVAVALLRLGRAGEAVSQDRARHAVAAGGLLLLRRWGDAVVELGRPPADELERYALALCYLAAGDRRPLADALRAGGPSPKRPLPVYVRDVHDAVAAEAAGRYLGAGWLWLR